MKNLNREPSVSARISTSVDDFSVTFFPDQKLSRLFSTPGGGRFSRAPPFVARNKAVHEIAYYQPCFRIWRPAPILPRTTLLDTGTKPLDSPSHPRPDRAPNPRTRQNHSQTARHLSEKGGLGGSTSRCKRDESGHDAKTSPPEPTRH
jgi:hypothetical protein